MIIRYEPIFTNRVLDLDKFLCKEFDKRILILIIKEFYKPVIA